MVINFSVFYTISLSSLAIIAPQKIKSILFVSFSFGTNFVSNLYGKNHHEAPILHLIFVFIVQIASFCFLPPIGIVQKNNKYLTYFPLFLFLSFRQIFKTRQSR